MHEFFLKSSIKNTEKVSFPLFFWLLNFWLLLKKVPCKCYYLTKNFLWIVKGLFNASDYDE